MITIIIVCTLTLTMFGFFSFSAVKAQSSEATVLSYSSYVAGSSNTVADFSGDAGIQKTPWPEWKFCGNRIFVPTENFSNSLIKLNFTN